MSRDLLPKIDDLLKEMISVAVSEALDREIEVAKDNVERELKKCADKIALHILSRYEVTRRATEVVIRVKKDD